MTFDSHVTLGYSTVAAAPSPDTSGTAMDLNAGDLADFVSRGLVLPANATVWPANSQPNIGNAEIVRVNTISGDSITLMDREQETTVARAIQVGDQIAFTETPKTFTDIEEFKRVRTVAYFLSYEAFDEIDVASGGLGPYVDTLSMGVSYTFSDGDRVLVAATPDIGSGVYVGSGIYEAHAGAWTRAPDWAAGELMATGVDWVFVEATDSLYPGLLNSPLMDSVFMGIVDTDSMFWDEVHIPIRWFSFNYEYVATDLAPSLQLNRSLKFIGGFIRGLGAEFQAPTNPPISTTIYQNTTGLKWLAALGYTLSPTGIAAADVLVEISPDGSTWTTWADPSLPATSLGASDSINFPVPDQWYYRITATNASLDSLVALG